MPWSPMQSLTRFGDEYLMYDKHYRVAIIRQVEISRPKGTLWRSVTGDEDPTERQLVGYFPTLEMAAAVTWRTWTQRRQQIESIYL